MEQYKEIIESAISEYELYQIKSKLLGKNSKFVEQIKAFKDLSIEEKARVGKQLNEFKLFIEELCEIQLKKIQENKNASEKIDYTVPEKIALGKYHIIPSAIDRLHEIFAKVGFNQIEGPDIEDVFYNFEALNIPIEHPARDNNDTFYMQQGGKLLRTHTTAAQIRLLESMQGKLENSRSYSIGRVYRNDEHDATHACSFHQVEGVIVESGVTIQHLKGFLEHLLSEFFDQELKIRFRPSYFPFTEPSCELDIFTKVENGKRVVSTSGDPLEVGGCGLIHPTILQRFFPGAEPPVVLAFGMGLERLIMIKYGITNLHDMYNNHIPTLKYIFQK